MRYRPVVLALAALALFGPAPAQAAAVQRTTLQQQNFPTPLHTVTVRIEIQPGGDVAPHTHPGAEMGFIVSGLAQVTIKGAAPRRLATGDSFAVPPEAIHEVKNPGSEPLVILSTYVVDPNRPLASPAK